MGWREKRRARDEQFLKDRQDTVTNLERTLQTVEKSSRPERHEISNAAHAKIDSVRAGITDRLEKMLQAEETRRYSTTRYSNAW